MGIIGNYVSIFLRHTFGIGSIALPIVLLIYGVQMLRHMEDEDLKRKAIIFIGFFITLISLAHTLKGWEPSSSLGDYISKWWTYRCYFWWIIRQDFRSVRCIYCTLCYPCNAFYYGNRQVYNGILKWYRRIYRWCS